MNKNKHKNKNETNESVPLAGRSRDPPYDESGDDSHPGEAAGAGPLDLLVFAPAAAAHAAEVDGEQQRAEAQPRRAHARQQDQRLQQRGQTRREGDLTFTPHMPSVVGTH